MEEPKVNPRYRLVSDGSQPWGARVYGPDGKLIPRVRAATYRVEAGGDNPFGVLTLEIEHVDVDIVVPEKAPKIV